MPGKRFLRSVLIQDEAQTADGLVAKDLPINPLSHIVLTIKALNETLTIGNFSPIAALLDTITKIEVLFKGTAVFSASARDTYILGRILFGFNAYQINTDDLDNEVRAVSIIIPTGRSLYNDAECFPGVKKGELQLQLTTDVAVTGADGLILQAETIELLDAKPERFLKVTTATKTPSAAQEEDTELPIGNQLAGVLLFGTTITIATAWASVVFPIDWIKLLVDNIEYGYSKANWESLFGERGWYNQVETYNQHIHRENTATAYTQNVDTAVGNDLSSLDDNYLFLDLDPSNDGAYILDTAGRSRVHLRINHGNTSAVRVLPLELVTPAQVGL